MLRNSNKSLDAKMYSLHAGCFKQEPAVRTQTLTQLQKDTITAVYNDEPHQLPRLSVFVPRVNTFPTRPKLVIFLRLCPSQFKNSDPHLTDTMQWNKLVYTFLNGFVLTVWSVLLMVGVFPNVCGLRHNHKDRITNFKSISKQFQR